MMARQKGDEGEHWVAQQLQRLFSGCAVQDTSRECQQGDIKLSLPSPDGGDDIVLMLEVKHHSNSVERRWVATFADHLASQSVWAHAGIFLSLSSTIHGKHDFDMGRTLTGPAREFCCISRVHERPELLEAAVRLVMARVLDQRRHGDSLSECAKSQRRGQLCSVTRLLIQAISSVEAAMHGQIAQLQKTRKIAEQIDRQVTGLASCSD